MTMENWIQSKFGVSQDIFLEAIALSPSSQGYIYGAISEILLNLYLRENGFEVFRIKEKPAGGFNAKKDGYKGDFLIHNPVTNEYYVVECKGLKSNSEFKAAETNEDHIKILPHNKAYNFLKKFFHPNKERIYSKGFSQYKRAQQIWCRENPNRSFPAFNWTRENPGADNVDITSYFDSLNDLKEFVNSCDENSLSEERFRAGTGLYKVLQTHEPSTRIDPITNIKQTAPLVSDFSIMAVDLYLRTGRHEFVFMNPNAISHSPTSPNHLYQNYIIDILIPGIKDDLTISHPWYTSIAECIECTSPKTVEYDDSQLDYR